jgi:hypothetical protein
VPRTDPTDNGGLFVGRRPGTAPVKYRKLPQRGSDRRRGVDTWLAGALLVLMVFVCLLFFGPIPVAWLWIASRVQYALDTVSVAIFVAFLGMLLTLLLGLRILRRLDLTWILVRRAAGYDQRTGMVGTVFAIATVTGVTLFAMWFLLLAGPGQR